MKNIVVLCLMIGKRLVLTLQLLDLADQVAVSLSQVVVSLNEILEVGEEGLMEQLDSAGRLELDDHSFLANVNFRVTA